MAAATALLVGAGVRSNLPGVLADWRHVGAASRQPHETTRDDRIFAALASSIPSHGRIGYLQPRDWPSADAVRLFYMAEYALTPRILVLNTSPAYLIVVPDAAVPEAAAETGKVDDSRLAGFVLVRRFEGGVRIFRRLE